MKNIIVIGYMVIVGLFVYLLVGYWIAYHYNYEHKYLMFCLVLWPLILLIKVFTECISFIDNEIRKGRGKK